MRVLLAAVMLAGCTVAVHEAPIPAPVHRTPTPAVIVPWNDAAGYIMRPDSDPDTIATIRRRLKTIRTARDAKSLRAFIRTAPHVK